MTPPGVSASTVWFFFAPRRAAPIGDSLDILFDAKSTSVDPTIVYSTSSSNSISCTFTTFPIWTVFVSTSDSSIIFAYLNLFSKSAILVSLAAWAFFASSYSEFSDKSPNPSATLILSAIAALSSVFKYSTSFSNLSYPSWVNNISFSFFFSHLLFSFYKFAFLF